MRVSLGASHRVSLLPTIILFSQDASAGKKTQLVTAQQALLMARLHQHCCYLCYCRLLS